MDEDTSSELPGEETPVFGAYRRGYDPDQVDRFVAEQQRQLDESARRAADAERKLAAAVSQMRELQRRVEILEAEERPAPDPVEHQPLDTLGERVQRIMQEAWDGAFALRETVETEVAERRAHAIEEAKDIVASARRKAQAIEEEIERRRRAYLERLEEDRARASAQIAHLNERRLESLEQLQRMRDAIEEVVIEAATLSVAEERTELVEERTEGEEPRIPARLVPKDDVEDLAPTMPVHRLEGIGVVERDDEKASLVRSHRESVRFTPSSSIARPATAEAVPPRTQSARAQATVFDFEQA